MSARSYNLDKRRHGNITVEKTDTRIEVILHGNTIIDHNLATGELKVSKCGWGTPTTRTALNRYFRLQDINANAYQAKNIQYLSYGQELAELDCSVTIFPNSRRIKNTKIARKINKVIAEKEGYITVGN